VDKTKNKKKALGQPGSQFLSTLSLLLSRPVVLFLALFLVIKIIDRLEHTKLLIFAKQTALIVAFPKTTAQNDHDDVTPA
jgi:hypothetical protein